MRKVPKKPKQGKFTPRHPEKYRGNPATIWFRSSWELDMMRWFDNNPSILEWGSETIFIRYRCPHTNRLRRYYPDFKVRYKKRDGSLQTEIIEVKPLKQTRKSKARSPDKYLAEQKVFATNEAKWQAAIEYCKNRNYVFRILTEKGIYK